MTARLRRPGLWLACLATWVALWGEDPSWGTVAGGVLAGGGVLLLTPVGVGGPMPRLGGTVRFVAYFVVALVRASLEVAWEVATPRNRVREGIVAIPLVDLPERVVTVIANAISLTPGTLTLEVVGDPVTLYVHVLHLRSADDARAGVGRLAAHVCAMFGCVLPEGGALVTRPVGAGLTEEASQ
jgi:multicomponent Na+:H+ antiporter subunit E